jgi:hypothetical protein
VRQAPQTDVAPGYDLPTGFFILLLPLGLSYEKTKILKTPLRGKELRLLVRPVCAKPKVLQRTQEHKVCCREVRYRRGDSFAFGIERCGD